jgi:hypothetical protein
VEVDDAFVIAGGDVDALILPTDGPEPRAFCWVKGDRDVAELTEGDFE